MGQLSQGSGLSGNVVHVTAALFETLMSESSIGNIMYIYIYMYMIPVLGSPTPARPNGIPPPPALLLQAESV